MKLFLRNLAILGVLILCMGASCQRTPPVPKIVVTPMGEQTQALVSSQAKQIEELTTQNIRLKDLMQNAAGGTYGVWDMSSRLMESLVKEGILAQLSVATSALPAPTDKQKADAARQNADILAGDLSKVKTELGIVVSENERLKADLLNAERVITGLREEMTQLIKSSAVEQERLRAEYQKTFDSMTRQIEEANKRADSVEAKIRREFDRTLGWVLLGLGALFAVVSAFLIYSAVKSGDPLKQGIRAGAIAGLSGFCFIAAWTINQWWFKWVVGIGIAFGIAAVFAFVISAMKEDRQKKELLERSKQADEAESTLKKIIPAVDEFKKSQPEVAKPLLTRLSDKLDDPQKALLHELRAEAKRETP